MSEILKLAYEQIPILITLKNAVDQKCEAIHYLVILGVIGAISDIPATAKEIERAARKIEKWLRFRGK